MTRQRSEKQKLRDKQPIMDKIESAANVEPMIIDALRLAPRTSRELSALLGHNPQSISQHCAHLRRVGMIESLNVGANIMIWQLADKPTPSLDKARGLDAKILTEDDYRWWMEQRRIAAERKNRRIWA